jgi:hypothetical protein
MEEEAGGQSARPHFCVKEIEISKSLGRKTSPILHNLRHGPSRALLKAIGNPVLRAVHSGLQIVLR